MALRPHSAHGLAPAPQYSWRKWLGTNANAGPACSDPDCEIVPPHGGNRRAHINRRWNHRMGAGWRDFQLLCRTHPLWPIHAAECLADRVHVCGAWILDGTGRGHGPMECARGPDPRARPALVSRCNRWAGDVLLTEVSTVGVPEPAPVLVTGPTRKPSSFHGQQQYLFRNMPSSTRESAHLPMVEEAKVIARFAFLGLRARAPQVRRSSRNGHNRSGSAPDRRHPVSRLRYG